MQHLVGLLWGRPMNVRMKPLHHSSLLLCLIRGGSTLRCGGGLRSLYLVVLLAGWILRAREQVAKARNGEECHRIWLGSKDGSQPHHSVAGSLTRDGLLQKIGGAAASEATPQGELLVEGFEGLDCGVWRAACSATQV